MKTKRASAIAVFALLLANAAFGFQPVPPESVKALRVTKGKQFSRGLVFVNGKYVPPPYRVDRRGTCLFVNGRQATGQVVGWTEFLKTQKDVKVTKAEAGGGCEEPEEKEPQAKEPAPSGTDEVSLDDLFGDTPKASAPEKKASARPARPPRPKVQVSYELEGEFKSNAASEALLSRINAARAKVDRILRTGGFICFGDGYARVTGDARTLSDMLDALPELLQEASDLEAFRAGVRAKHLVYFGDRLCEDLYRNRLDYPKLKARRKEMKGFDFDSL